MQKFMGAIVREQGMTFGVVLVQRITFVDQDAADEIREALAGHSEFAGMPIIFAALNSGNRLAYDGPADIVKFLDGYDHMNIVFRDYTV